MAEAFRDAGYVTAGFVSNPNIKRVFRFDRGFDEYFDSPVEDTVTLASIELEHRRAEIGFALAREHRGQGHASAAVQLVLGHAFEAMALHRIEADVDPRNGPSIALLERVGFRREGLQLQRWLLHGEWQDALLFGLLAPWWRQLRGRAG